MPIGLCLQGLLRHATNDGELMASSSGERDLLWDVFEADRRLRAASERAFLADPD